jgi:hypothetical protein
LIIGGGSRDYRNETPGAALAAPAEHRYSCMSLDLL